MEVAPLSYDKVLYVPFIGRRGESYIVLYVPFIGRRGESYILRETNIEPQHEPVNRTVSETTQLEGTLKQ